MPGHFNAERAARTVEAAAQQGKFEDIYRRMDETQEAWGEKRIPLDKVFRTFALDLGLDMAQYDADYANPATAERVVGPVRRGSSRRTPHPDVLPEREAVAPRSYEDLTDALDAALANHAVVLTCMFAALVGLITHRFWDYGVSLPG